MKITKIEIFHLQSDVSSPFGWSQGWTSTRCTGLVKITTDSGLAGWGEGAGGAVSAIIQEILAPLLIGQDPMNRIGLWEKMYHSLYNGNLVGGFGGSALSGIDIALWDLTGKATGLSVSQLLGGAGAR